MGERCPPGCAGHGNGRSPPGSRCVQSDAPAPTCPRASTSRPWMRPGDGRVLLPDLLGPRYPRAVRTRAAAWFIRRHVTPWTVAKEGRHGGMASWDDKARPVRSRSLPGGDRHEERAPCHWLGRRGRATRTRRDCQCVHRTRRVEGPAIRGIKTHRMTEMTRWAGESGHDGRATDPAGGGDGTEGPGAAPGGAMSSTGPSTTSSSASSRWESRPRRARRSRA